MGVVYQARQLSLNRIVALKTIRSGEFANEEEVRRFRLEAEAAARLDHPGIVPVFEVGEHGRLHYFSMGFVDGPKPLGAHPSGWPVPPGGSRLAAAIGRRGRRLRPSAGRDPPRPQAGKYPVGSEG